MKTLCPCLLLIALCVPVAGCGRTVTPQPTNAEAVLPTEPTAGVATQLTSATPAQVAHFCGGCHATPDPGLFPRDAWPAEVERGFGLYFESRREDLVVPRVVEVVNYYRERAPIELVIPAPEATSVPSPVRWRVEDGEAGDRSVLPSTAHLRPVPTAPASTTASATASATNGSGSTAMSPPVGPRALLACDMRLGEVRRAAFDGNRWVSEWTVPVASPAHAEPVDLDRDGHDDLVVADMAGVEAADHARGKVLWLRWNPTTQRHETKVLAAGLGRVADVRPADLDNDGDPDLVVGEFGWHRTGQVFILWNERCSADDFSFRRELLESYPGAIHVPVVDLDADGRPDIVALISQDQEMAVCFFNQGSGRFTRRVLWRSDDPSLGLSGMEPVDLDGDGDLDLLLTSGDTFDNLHIKPYHGVHLLRNHGAEGFRFEPLALLPGAYRALPGDFDNDGDLDIVACAFLTQEPLNAFDAPKFHSLVLLEQTAAGGFVRHPLEHGRFQHPTLAVDDFNGDGALDIAVGECPRDGATPHPRFRVWWNVRP